MKLQNITITDFLGLRAFRAEFGNLTLFCGPNGSGKSTIRDAIAFALTGRPSRGIVLKKDFACLAHNGAKRGQVAVTAVAGLDQIEFARDTKTATCPGSFEISGISLMPYCLDPGAFSALSADDRRRVIFEISGLSPTPKEVANRLVKRGVDPVDAKAWADMVTTSDFGHIAAQVKSLAREEKGVWRGITGEIWGAEKALNWCSPVTGLRDETELKTQVDALNSEIAKAQKELGVMSGATQERVRRLARIAELKHAGDPEDVAQQLADAQKIFDMAVQTHDDALNDLELARGAVLEKNHWECPKCQAKVVFTGSALEEYVPPKDGRGHTLVELKRMEDRVAALKASVSRKAEIIGSMTDRLEKANRARETIEELNQGLPEDRASLLGPIKSLIAKKEGERSALVEGLLVVKGHNRAVQRAIEDTQAAAETNRKILNLLRIGEAMEPSGIQSELLHDALSQLNERLSTICSAAGWDGVGVADDMTVYCGHRPYQLCSESEQWRINASMAIAIATLSGVGFSVLDRMDVLDLRSREKLMAFLYSLTCPSKTALGEFSCVVLATLKEPPKERPGFVVHWLG